MSAIAVEKISAELEVSSSNRHQIRKAFNLLKTHASAVANFTLQWQDLEDHLQSIHNSIQTKLYELQNPHKHPNPKPQDSNPNSIPIHDGKKLIIHLKERLKEQDSLRDGVQIALRASEDSAKVVLDAIGEFYPAELNSGVIDSELSGVRRSCLLLLEELMKVRPLISSEVREEALKVASAWKAKLNLEMKNSMEVFAFLMLLVAYGLVGEYDRDEILSLIGNLVQRRQAPELFKSLGLSDKASEFIQNLISEKKYLEAVRFIYAFELADKFPPVPLLQDHVNDAKKAARTVCRKNKSSSKEKDDATNKELAALRGVIRCIEDYKLESEYSPEDLKLRIKSLRKQKSERKEKEKNAKNKAQAPQVSGKKRAFPDSKSQMKDLQNRNKHPRSAQVEVVPTNPARLSATVHSVHHQPVGLFEGERAEYLMPSARMVVVPAAASPIAGARVAAVHAVHRRPIGLLEGEGAEYLLTSAAAAPASGSHASFAAASNFYSIEASHYQPAGSSMGQGTQYSSGYHNLARSALDAHVSLPPNSRGLMASPSQYISLTNGAHGSTGSILDAHHISSSHYRLTDDGHLTAHVNLSAEQYGRSGRNRHFGSPGAPQHGIASNASPLGSLAYYHEGPLRVATHSDRPLLDPEGRLRAATHNDRPLLESDGPLRVASHSDRPLSSSSGYDYEPVSKRPYVFHI